MLKNFKALSLLAVLAGLTLSNAAHAAYINSPRGWTTPSGDYLATQLLGGGGSNAISATYDVDTQVFQLTSNYLPGFYAGGQQVGNVLFSMAAFVSNTGAFSGGTFSMIVGPAGVTGLGLSPGSLLLSGSVLELESEWTTIPTSLCGGTVCWVPVTPFGTPSLLSVGFSAPELNLTSGFLTMLPYVLQGLRPDNPWSSSFSERGQLGWTLWDTVKVAEPATLALFVLGLVALGVARRRASSARVVRAR